MRIAGIDPESNEPITVITKGTAIEAIERGIDRPDIGSEDVYISAGMIDLMVPGYGGKSFSDPALSRSDIHCILQKLHASGTTHIYPLLATSSREVYAKVLQTIDEFASQESYANSIFGVHMEGPYLSQRKGPAGAQNPEQMRDPDFEEFSRSLQCPG